MFVHNSRFFTRGEVWFGEEADKSRVDWILYRQRPSPLTRCRWRKFHTVLIDLRATPTELLARMDERTAHKISQARQNDRLECRICGLTNSNSLDQVEEMWNQHAAVHGTACLDRRWLEEVRQAGALDMVSATDAAGRVLAYHLVLLRPKRARQLVAIAPYKAANLAWRNAVSRANCLLHWFNFQRFVEQGIVEFDFGGWYPGKTDICLLGINRFKMSFGGRIVREYNCDQPISVKGWALLTAAQWWSSLRKGHVFNRTPGGSDAIRPEKPDVSPAF